MRETDVIGNAGNPIGQGLGPYYLTNPPGWTGSLWTDYVSGPQTPFRYQASGRNNSTNRDGGVYKTVFFGWPFEGISALADRSTVLGRIVDYFGGCAVQPGILTGQVTHDYYGTPIAEATVTATPAAKGAAIQATTDPNGYYTLTLDAGTYNVTASKDGYTTETIPGVVVVGGGVTVLDIALSSPVIVVSPKSLHAHILPSGTVTLTLNVANPGDMDLTFEIAETTETLRLAGRRPAEPPVAYVPEAVAEQVGAAPEAPAGGKAGTLWARPEAVLWDNGPLVTHQDACAGGTQDASRLQTSLGMTTLGFGHQFALGNRMADDFEITDPGGWQIDTITFFAYQTGAPMSPSPITGVYLQIWNGPPWVVGSSVVWGDLVTNRLLSSTFTSIQRDSETSPCPNNRYIFANVVGVGVHLPPGTYWLDWMTDGNPSYIGPWAPPITILGQRTTGDAYQYTGAWALALDSGTGTQQGMPFVIEGTPGPVSVTISFDVTVTAYCGATIHNEGIAGDGTSVVTFTADTDVLGEPDIATDPPTLWAELCPDSTDTMTMTICNVGTCDLEWQLREMTRTLAGSMPFVPVKVEGAGVNPGLTAASPQASIVAVPPSPEDVLWDQPLSGVNQNAYVDQEFTDYPAYSSFLADDFVNAEPWAISTIFVPGNGWSGFTTLLNADSLTWQIYADDGTGFPAGDPSGGGNPPVWTLTLPPNDPQVVLSNGSGGMPSNTTLNLATPLVLPPGHWWLVFYPTMAFGTGGQYGRQPADTTNGYVGKFINPGGAFGYGTVWQNWTILGVTQQDIAFRLEGESVPPVDVPWLSEDPTAGTIPPGECAAINVTFDATGMAPGDYLAALLVQSNDPDTPEVTIPVTMTVLEPANNADFTWAPTSPLVGEMVVFTATVSGSEPLTYAWDFGDNTSVSGPVVTHTYSAAGTYTVLLTVTNDCGLVTATHEIVVVQPCDPPAGADFSWTPITPTVGELVHLTGTVVSGTPPFTYTWDFGNGVYGSGQYVSHAYATAGTYTVALTATNACGYATATHAIVVRPRPPTHFYIYLPLLYKGFATP